MKFHKKTVLFAYILIFFLTYLAQIHPINALDYNISCVNGYLIKNATIKINDNTHTFFQNTSCPYGCADNGIECDDLVSEEGNFVLYPIALLVVAAIFGFLAVRTDAKCFQFLFLGLTMIFIILSMGIFNITADDITLDCDNYMLFATEQLNDYAVIAEGRDNITVKNCYMKNWSLAIKLSNTPNSLIDNMTIYNTTDFSSEDVSAVGIYINASDNMTITNINITKMETDSSSTSACYHASVIRGIYIDSSSNITITNATFDDINGTYTGDTSPEEGCQSGEVQTGETIRFWNSGNITITNVNINDSYYGIYSHTSSSDSYVYDSKISLIEYKDVRLYYATLYLYNTTFNDSQTLLAGTAKLYVYQYLRANITDSSFSPIDSADVNFTDAFNTVTQNTTDANGLTDWVLLQSFNETSTLITYFTPYNISAWKSGYNLNWTTTNLNESHTVLVMLSSAAVSTCIYGDSGNWEIDCTENCTIENNYDLNGNNITATGLGNITVSANLTNVDMFIKDNNCLIIKGVGYEIS